MAPPGARVERQQAPWVRGAHELRLRGEQHEGLEEAGWRKRSLLISFEAVSAFWMGFYCFIESSEVILFRYVQILSFQDSSRS